MISKLNVFDSVELSNKNKEDKHLSYQTKVQELSDDNIIYVMRSSSVFPFTLNSKYKLILNTDTGILSWHVIFLGPSKVDNLPAYKFKAISGPFETQRREFYRQSTSLDCQLVHLEDPYTIPRVWHKQITSKIIDISGGGCSILCNNELEVNDFYLFNFILADKHYSFVGEILFVEKLETTNYSWNYRYRVKWDENNKLNNVDSLITSMFKYQRELLQNQK